MADIDIINEAKINKWFNYQMFYDFIAGKNFKKHAEIGAGKGHGVVFLAQALLKRKEQEVFAVDRFDKHTKAMYDYNKSRASDKVQDIITELQGESVEVAEQFEDGYFDFVFIDASHEYEDVKADILAWLPKIRGGGIIAGHDYVDSQREVRKAVDELFPNRKLHKGYVWYVELDENITGEGR